MSKSTNAREDVLRTLRAELLAALALATFIALAVTAYDVATDPAGVHRSGTSLRYDVVFETLWSWWVPLAAAFACIAVVRGFVVSGRRAARRGR